MQKIYVGKTILYESSRYGVENTVFLCVYCSDIDIWFCLFAHAMCIVLVKVFILKDEFHEFFGAGQEYMVVLYFSHLDL